MKVSNLQIHFTYLANKVLQYCRRLKIKTNLVVDMNGVLKQATPRCLLLRKAWSTNLLSEAGSILQKLPLPGSS